MENEELDRSAQFPVQLAGKSQQSNGAGPKSPYLSPLWLAISCIIHDMNNDFPLTNSLWHKPLKDPDLFQQRYCQPYFQRASIRFVWGGRNQVPALQPLCMYLFRGSQSFIKSAASDGCSARGRSVPSWLGMPTVLVKTSVPGFSPPSQAGCAGIGFWSPVAIRRSSTRLAI